jgi:hypothetical protein
VTCTIKKKQGGVGRRGLYKTLIMQTGDEVVLVYRERGREWGKRVLGAWQEGRSCGCVQRGRLYRWAKKENGKRDTKTSKISKSRKPSFTRKLPRSTRNGVVCTNGTRGVRRWAIFVEARRGGIMIRRGREEGGRRQEGRGKRALGQWTQHRPQLATSTVTIPQLSAWPCVTHQRRQSL